ncbi:hypothetical protein D7D81_11090 [Halocella sp. SP3-1]|nr:hypothetical protein D7D81_11090 [Halocella sp. SP3-1]
MGRWVNKLLQTKPKSDYNYGYINNKNSSNNKKTKNSIDFKTIISFILIVTIIALILISYICQSVNITRLNYTLTKLSKEYDKIQEENHKLNIELARNKSLARIEKLARNDLHMSEPDRVEVVVLNKEEEIKEDTVPEQKKTYFAQVLGKLFNKSVKAEELDN